MKFTMRFTSNPVPLAACLGIVLVLAASFAFAEVITIDVTVKAVDAKERSITVTKTSKTKSKDIELEVGKKAKISVGGKETALDDIKPRQKATVSYESDLEIVTKIEVVGDSDDGQPKDGPTAIDFISKFNADDSPPQWKISKDKKNPTLTATTFDGTSQYNWTDAMPPEYDLKVTVSTIRQNGTNDINVNLPRDGRIYPFVMRKTANGEVQLSFWPTDEAKKRGIQLGQNPIGVSPKLPGLKVEFEFKVRKESITILAGGKKMLSLKDDSNILFSEGSSLSLSTWHNDSVFHSVKLNPISAVTPIADAAKSLEVLNLDEINSPGNDVNPSLTSDGLSIVWQSAIGDEAFIYEATRTAPEALFSERKKLFAGFNPVIASDGQSLLFYNPSSKSVNESRRIADSRDFGRPVTATGLEMVAYPTGITEDGLTLYLDIHPPQKDDGHSPAHVATRAKRSDKWRKPVPVKVVLRDKPFRHRVMSVCPVPGDESAITCNLIVQLTKDSEEENRPVIMVRSEPIGPFSKTEALVIPKPTGEPGRFFAPRYIPATRELVFQSNQHFADSEIGNKKGVDLWLVREFEVNGVGSKPGKDAK